MQIVFQPLVTINQIELSIKRSCIPSKYRTATPAVASCWCLVMHSTNCAGLQLSGLSWHFTVTLCSDVPGRLPPFRVVKSDSPPSCSMGRRCPDSFRKRAGIIITALEETKIASFEQQIILALSNIYCNENYWSSKVSDKLCTSGLFICFFGECFINRD